MNKQIEEMARVMNKANGLDDTPAWYNDFLPDAEALYNAGYRKSTDVAREIFAQVDGITDLFAVGDIGELEMYDMLGKLKKKYESEGE